MNASLLSGGTPSVADSNLSIIRTDISESININRDIIPLDLLQ
jgi:hypothetical protein